MTFKNGENKLQMNISCTECGNQDVIDIQKENFSFFTLPEKLKRFYDYNECAFVIKLKDTGEEFKIYMPTLGVTNFIKQYVRKRQSNNRNIDKAFLRISPFLFGNWRTLNDVKYDATNEESFKWSFKKMSAIIGIIDMLQSAINPEITDTCTSCGTEVKAPISFQGGIKKLFLFTFDDNRDFFDEFV
jgi:ribosomal protein S27E